MNILLTNDDGIESEGIRVLVDILKHQANIFVSAPQFEQSGASNSMTMTKPLRFKEYSIPGALAFGVDGTPADCVKLAMHMIFKDISFDFVISGINKGENTGINALYSGTISAATEASILGKKAMAVSLYAPFKHFLDAAKVVKDLIPVLESTPLKKGSILNVNIPDIPISEYRGFRYTRQGTMIFRDKYEERISPRGEKYYWQHSEVINKDEDQCTDFNSTSAGYVSITPLTKDRTDYDLLEKLSAS